MKPFQYRSSTILTVEQKKEKKAKKLMTRAKVIDIQAFAERQRIEKREESRKLRATGRQQRVVEVKLLIADKKAKEEAEERAFEHETELMAVRASAGESLR